MRCAGTEPEGVVAIGKVVFTSREHIIALEARDKGMMGITLNGRDAGRLQYRYHPGWRRVREMRKTGFARLAEVTRIGCSRPPIAPKLLAESFRHAHAAKSFVQELA
jgi:hypothetical protein